MTPEENCAPPNILAISFPSFFLEFPTCPLVFPQNCFKEFVGDLCLMSVYQVQILYCQSPVSVLDWHCLGTGDAAVNMAKPWPGGVDILTLDILLSFISLVSSSCKNRNPAQRPWLPTHPVHSMTILLGEKPTPFFFTLSSLASFILATFCLPVLWIASMPAQSLKWVTCYWEQALGSDSLGLKPHSSTSVM